MPHTTRPEQSPRHPLHVTSRVRAGLPNLREARTQRLLVDTLRAGCDRFGFRLIEYSVQTNHFHLVVEVPDRTALTRGAKGLFVRLAKQLNKRWGRKGNVFPDRFHARALETPRAVRNALVYVLHNARKHRCWGSGVDPFSSGPWFEGYRDRAAQRASAGSCRSAGSAGAAGPAPPRSWIVSTVFPDGSEWVISGLADDTRMQGWPRPVRRARSWLLAVGWRRFGAIGLDEAPASAA
ncbi:MAG: hypothetical protein EPO68_05065 [Planctomycetota bacterium]|nr:MAG: hypothetical protein EPO68_05065 [Planctomycetota bacterium]